ncbi:MAG: hypothetical protein NVSMB48_27240 [Marmoricola sp.]
MTAPGSRPIGESVDVTLRGGSQVHIRPVRGDDLDAVRAFLGGLSPESVILRFLGAADLDWASRWSVEIDDSDRCALVATVRPDGAIVAHGAYVREAADRAEMAFVVADAYHELGVATVLLRRLAGLARAHGIGTLTAFVLPGNRHMTDVFRDGGYPGRFRTEAGQTRVEMATSVVRVEPWPGGGWAVRLHGHPTPISRHDTEDEAAVKASSYQRGLERAVA